MDYADIYYVDTRNATNDHRTGQPSTGRPVSSTPVIAGGQGVRTVYMPGPNYGPQMPYGQPVMYGPIPQQSAVGALFGKLTTGQVVEMVAQIFAALQPLPAAPNATKDASTDVGNLILFQGALAQHAKRDEQVRTLGGLVAKLVG